MVGLFTATVQGRAEASIQESSLVTLKREKPLMGEKVLSLNLKV